MKAPYAAAACTRAAGDMLAVPSSVPGDAHQRVAAGPQPCELDAGADRRLRGDVGSNALNPMVLYEGFLRSSLRTSGRSAQSCAGSTPTSSMRPGACVAGTHWSSPPIPSHPHPHPHLSPPLSPPPAQAGGLLPFFCAAINIVVFALRRAMDAGRAGLGSLALADVCGGQVWPAFAPFWPAGVKRWATAVGSERMAVPALRHTPGKTRSTRALEVHRRALGWLEMAQTRCGPGRRIKRPRSAGRRGSGHALRSLLHLVLLSAAIGFRLPSSQQAPPGAQAVGFSQRENADRDNEPPLPAAGHVAIAGQVRGARRAASAVTVSGCTSDWSVALPRAPPFSCAPNHAAACCPQQRRSLLSHELCL